MRYILSGSLGLLCLFLVGCHQPHAASDVGASAKVTKVQEQSMGDGLSDPNATPETRALYQHLQNIKQKYSLFGQHEATAYGFTWEAEPNRADVKDVTGSFPAVVGWDFAWLEHGEPKNVDGVSIETMRKGMQEVFKRGGVNTLSWHMRNPVTGGDHGDKTPAVKEMLPGGSKHALFLSRLDAFAAFNESLKIGDTYIPIIFRPWHEHNGEWFWWGKGNVTEQDYIALWRFTIDYLREKKQMHNLIIATSPDRSRIDLTHFSADYLYAYPGDNYVDIMGLDDYWDLGHSYNKASAAEQLMNFSQSLAEVATIANAHHKLAALTETGSEAIPNPQFWTQVLLKGLTANDLTKQTVYVMVWRNATNGGFNGHHFYAPYKGQASAADFIQFKQNDFIVFEDELPVKYQ